MKTADNIYFGLEHLNLCDALNTFFERQCEHLSLDNTSDRTELAVRLTNWIKNHE